MGEIMHHDFNKGIDKEPELKHLGSFGEDYIDDSFEDLPDSTNEMEENILAYIEFVKFKKSDAFQKLMNLQTTKEALAQAEKTVKNYTLEELVGWLKDHPVSEYNPNPSFYIAVYKELEMRLAYHSKGNR